jgi:hypothetical protein
LVFDPRIFLCAAALAAAACGSGLKPLLVGAGGASGAGGSAAGGVSGDGGASDGGEAAGGAGGSSDAALDGVDAPSSPPDASDGSMGETPADGADDAGGSDGRAVACSASQPFGAPMGVPGFETLGGPASCARLSPDELRVSVAIGITRTDLYTATRASRGASFGTLFPLDDLDSGNSDSCVTLTADGTTAYFESDRSSGFGLWTSTRASTADSFPEPTALSKLNVYGEGGPYLANDDRTLYFHSWRGAGDANLYSVERTATGFGSITPININTDYYDELAPVVTQDQLTLYFARSTGHQPTPGQLDIFMATRASADAPFDPPVRLDALSTSVDEGPSWISPDNCRLYFHRIGVGGGWSAYFAERSP